MVDIPGPLGVFFRASGFLFLACGNASLTKLALLAFFRLSAMRLKIYLKMLGELITILVYVQKILTPLNEFWRI